MKIVLEDEAKVTLPAGVALPELSDARLGLVADARPPVTMTTHYVDTEDLRLHAAGISVRRRTRGRATTWDVKVPVRRGHTSARREVTFGERSVATPRAVNDLLLAWTGGDPLLPLATLRTRRLTWSVRDSSGTEVAEVVDDEVSHVDGRTVVATFREVEVERRGVPEEYVARLVRRLVKAGGELASTTKLGRVVPAPREPVVRVGRSKPVTSLVTVALREAAADLLLADVGARLREDDAVHQMRVACRRLRSVLRGFGDVLDPVWRDEVAAELRWVGESLGAARDMEVLAARVAAATADLGDVAAPLLADVAARRAVADAAVTDLLGSQRYVAIARRLRTDPPRFAGDAVPSAADAAAQVVTAAQRELERSVKRARRPGAPDAAWHAARLAAKRARYAAESVARVGGKDAKRLARRAEAVQDALGVFHDTAGCVALVASLAAERTGDGAYGFVAGRLTEREIAAGRGALAVFDSVWAGLA